MFLQKAHQMAMQIVLQTAAFPPLGEENTEYHGVKHPIEHRTHKKSIENFLTNLLDLVKILIASVT